MDSVEDRTEAEVDETGAKDESAEEFTLCDDSTDDSDSSSDQATEEEGEELELEKQELKQELEDLARAGAEEESFEIRGNKKESFTTSGAKDVKEVVEEIIEDAVNYSKVEINASASAFSTNGKDFKFDFKINTKNDGLEQEVQVENEVVSIGAVVKTSANVSEICANDHEVKLDAGDENSVQLIEVESSVRESPMEDVIKGKPLGRTIETKLDEINTPENDQTDSNKNEVGKSPLKIHMKANGDDQDMDKDLDTICPKVVRFNGGFGFFVN